MVAGYGFVYRMKEDNNPCPIQCSLDTEIVKRTFYYLSLSELGVKSIICIWESYNKQTKSIIAVRSVCCFISSERRKKPVIKDLDCLLFCVCFFLLTISRVQGSFQICIQSIVVLSQRKGHICLLLYTATKLSGIRNDYRFSSLGNLSSSDRRCLFLWPRSKHVLLPAWAAAHSQRAMVLQE